MAGVSALRGGVGGAGKGEFRVGGVGGRTLCARLIRPSVRTGAPSPEGEGF